MRTRSFEGGPGSPKDETTNWFDEFKARMIKKSQTKSSNNATAQQSTNTEDDDSVGVSNEPSVRFAPTSSAEKPKHHFGRDEDQIVKDTCDTTDSSGKMVAGSGGGNDEFASVDNSKFSVEANSNFSSSKSSHQTTNTFLRARKLQRISCVDRPDFDTASINTIFNRRDSRYNAITRRRKRMILTRILDYLKSVVVWLLPINYNLPWKLISFMNFSFVVLIIALTSGQNPQIKAFNFFYGFVSGILVATSCAIILALSLLVQFLPKSASEDNGASDSSVDSQHSSTHLHSPNISSINSGDFSQEDVTLGSPQLSSDDFSNYEVLDEGDREDADVDATLRNEALLDDDNYKGWMIEFIGDYELRNKSDIKLKLIFVKIENKILYLCKTKSSNDPDSVTFPTIVQQRIYNLNIAKKFSANLLLPKTVRNRQKWIWSKKYPIKLNFQIDSESTTMSKSSSSDALKNIQLTLFAKSCREKEEWFRRFKRIVEDYKLTLGNTNNKRSSFQSDVSGGDIADNPFGSLKSFRCRSPSPSTRCESVQTSRSSHLLVESVKDQDDDSNKQHLDPSATTNLVRTKSCELFQQEQATSTTTPSTDPSFHCSADADDTACGVDMEENDSTLTRATAEMFSQAVEYSNFIDSRPSLNYKDYIERVIESNKDATSTSDWFNSLTGRIFFDVFSHNYWSVWFKRKIQSKLYRIRLPYFMETLTLTKIDLGTNAPHFLNVASHSFDSFGLSIDFDMAYSGGLTMTFETKLNLLKIKSDSNNQSGSGNSAGAPTNNNQTPSSGNLNTETVAKDSMSESSLDSHQSSRESTKASFSSSGSTRTSGESSDSEDSDSDSSSDSSFDEADVDEISDWEDYGAEKTRQSIVRFVDKIASSRYFQQATENRYIKKKLQDISNCPLVLVVKIQSLNGVLTLNVPPPQTNRVWYGFKPNPELTLKALPKMGDREVNLSHVTDWIERKLAEEFRKILVIPNMEDIVLPILKSDHLQYVMTTK